MRVLVCGGRNFRSAAQVHYALDKFHAVTPILELMEGGATGVDRYAAEWCHKQKNIRKWVCHADWEKHGKAAGPMRNQRMIEWGPDVVIAFPGGKGTADMVARARKAGIKLVEIT